MRSYQAARRSFSFMEFMSNALIGIGVLGAVAAFLASDMIGMSSYLAYRLYKDSPKRAERIAREETIALYHAARPLLHSGMRL